MGTNAVHFLTIVGRPGEEAAAAIETLKANRRRLAEADPDEEFEDEKARGVDPLTVGFTRDEPAINAFCFALLETAHRLPTLYYSQFVFNFTGPRKLVDVLCPNPARAFAPVTQQALCGFNFHVHCFTQADAPATLAAIDRARGRRWPGEDKPAVSTDIDARMFLDHLRAALQQSSCWPFTVVVLEQCIGGTRECFEIDQAIESSLGIPRPVYYDLRPATPDDRDALTNVWLRSVRATHTFLTDADIDALLPIVRDQALPNLDVTVLTADGQPAGFMGMDGNKIEALFVDPDHFRRSNGTLLLSSAWRRHRGLRVSVNEQNPGAVAFYKRRGFEAYGRSETDGQGRPFPLLHLKAGQFPLEKKSAVPIGPNRRPRPA